MVPEGWEGTGLEVLHTQDFEGTRLRRPGTYAVCFAATWCPPTRRFVPKFVARNGSVPAQFALADISDNDDPLWDTFRIEITPSMAVFHDGGLVGRFDGRPILALNRKDLDQMAHLIRRISGAKGAGAPDASPRT
jgi:hypothetical protein